MRKLAVVVVVLAASLALAKAPPSDAGLKVQAADGHGVPTFVTGELGRIDLGTPGRSAISLLRSRAPLLRMTGNEAFRAVGVHTDRLGKTHVKLQETLHGLPVFGAQYVVHADAQGNVYAINGHFAPDHALPRAASIAAPAALARAMAQDGIRNGRVVNAPSLTYVMNEKGNTFLAWSAYVEYSDANGPERDLLFADASTGDLVLTAPQYMHARDRRTYTANNGTSLPGTLVLTETSGSTSDSVVQAAHDNAGNVYNYYWNVFSRDSYDNAGATIISSAHYDVNYNNAYWDGTQMVYGDGDGTTFSPLAKALDVDAHELTHAVTEHSANLTYSNESGALNEATSDIMGNTIEAYTRNGGTPNSNTWKVGEDVYTPGTAGDALRYMNDPAAAGDVDYYPDRYTGTSDNGGVHTNSGIANLAYYLMVMGGTHPRNKSSVQVTPLSTNSTTSLDMASRIWYRALTVYFTSSTTFQDARNATAQAAADLYGGTGGAAYNTVESAWDCVGVPGGSGGGGGSGVTVLSNGQTVSNLSGASGSWQYFKISVPSGETSLQIDMSGGSGDADLYVKYGSQPTSSSYDYRPYLTGNNESVSVSNPSSGDWYIGINGYASYSGVSLTATYSSSGGGGGGSCTSYSGSLSGTGDSDYQPNGTYYYSGTSGTHSGQLTGPSSGADFDLYLYKWNGSSWTVVASSESATANESISYSGTSGYYEYEVYSYSGSGSYSLCISHP